MKSKKFPAILAISLLILVCGFNMAEDPDFLSRLREKLGAYNAAYPDEKVYVQCDKPFYKPGEDIWFSVFVLDGQYKPTKTSDVVYVELVDPKGNIATRLELFVKEGTSYGDFSLDQDAAGGLYTLRAYTQWMKNFGEKNIFSKEIQVQRIITPRLLLKLDFDKESYGADDEVAGKLNIRNLKNESERNATVKIIAKAGATIVSQATVFSDSEGVAAFKFRLPAHLNSTDGLLQAVVSVKGLEESISRSIPIVLNKIDLAFFPEGGQLVENVVSRVAFKALNEFGKGADVAGTILDETNAVVATFESFHMGMGDFELKPIPGKKYFARIESPAGTDKLFPLPSATPSGFRLQLRTNTLTFTEWNIFSPVAARVNLVAQSHGEIVYAEPVTLTAGNNLVRVPLENFPAGIAVFTLFDAQGTGRCERLAFVQASRKLNISLKPNKQKYLPGEKVQLKVVTEDDRGRRIPAKLSLAVADDQIISFADDKQDNLLSSMWLSSEVKGEVQEPSFYFDPKEKKAPKALDYLLMTQGWRRFTWDKLNGSGNIMTYAAEKITSIIGQLTDAHGRGMEGEVTFMEAGNQKRIETVRTTQTGHFVFRNIDPATTVLLLTRKPGRIALQKEKGFSVSLNDRDGTVLTPESIAEKKPQAGPEEVIREDAVEVAAGLNVNLGADVAQLSEVVVVGHGTQDKRKLVGSIGTIYEQDVNKFAVPSVEQVMQGRIAGVAVQAPAVNGGATIRLRGHSSLMGGRGEPLYVVNGHPIATSVIQDFPNGGMIGPDEIQTIEVMSSPEATALFGSAAANGVILITTRSNLSYTDFQTSRKPARYWSLSVPPRKFSGTREFYTPPVVKKRDGQRDDFRSTIYWDQSVVTDANGEATVSFYNNDAVSAFRITAEGFSGTGLIGRQEEVFSTQLPFSIDVKLPEFIGFEDVLKLTVTMKNETNSTRTGKVKLNIPAQLSVNGLPSSEVEVPAESTAAVTFTVTSNGVAGEFPISVNLLTPGYEDEIRHTLRVDPVGFPVRLSFSGKEVDKKVKFAIRDAEKGTIKAELSAFPNVLADLFTGAESILREPCGCFEQTSSSTFPNILALQFMQQTGTVNEAIEQKALGYIRNGYKRLISFEVKGGGFDWFGRPPAHEALSAYGLIEFHEMKKVYPEVSDALIKRTREWLLSRRANDGTFRLPSGGLDDFSRPGGDVTNAYITYALSETGEKSLEKEFQYNLAGAWESKDMYVLALMANTAFNLGKQGDYRHLIAHFEKNVLSHGLDQLYADHSVVWSQGISLSNETVSLWALALMKAPAPNLSEVSNCINYLLSRRSFGGFGSTQGTILSLKALTEYARLTRASRSPGEIQVFVSDQLAQKRAYDKNVRDQIVLTDFAGRLAASGDNTLRVHFAGTDDALPYSVNLEWYTKQPQANEGCKVALTTSIESPVVQLNETVRMKIELKSKSSKGQPMTVAVVGIPAGLSAQPWQLKELQEKKIFDFYEISGGKLVLYYRQLEPAAVHTINLDLKAEIRGSFQGSASSAYLYYTSEFKDWVEGVSITVN